MSDTRRKNMTFEGPILDEVQESADRLGISPGSYIRTAVAEKLARDDHIPGETYAVIPSDNIVRPGDQAQSLAFPISWERDDGHTVFGITSAPPDLLDYYKITYREPADRYVVNQHVRLTASAIDRLHGAKEDLLL